MNTIHLIVGARPNFMKIAPLYRELKRYPDEFEVRLIHTGQHYDERMSQFFFDDLGLPEPDEYLEVGSGSHGEQTARIIERYEVVLLRDRPDLVVVAGDVNSTLACALDAVKHHIPVAHLEAGLRSFDITMPEEINRIVTDRISRWLLTPSPDGDKHLLSEGVPQYRIHRVGNIMIDSLVQHRDRARVSSILDTLNLEPRSYGLVTLHRPSNVDHQSGLEIIIEAFEQLAHDIDLVFPIHPRTLKRLEEFGLKNRIDTISRLRLIEPVGYFDFLRLEMDAALVLTDSGGVQEETTFFGVPCLTLRPNTERPITITEGTNRLVELRTDAIVDAAQSALKRPNTDGRIPDLWDGHTAERIVKLWREAGDRLGDFV